MSVHDHGPTEGRGLDCPETRLPDGSLRGACLDERERRRPMELSEWREELAGVLRGALADRCSHCWRPIATEADWENADDDVNDSHLCWEEPSTCGWIFGTDPHELAADALLASPAMARLLAEVRAEAWDEGFAVGYWLDRGYGFDEARAKGIPEHLRPELGLEPSDEPTWNPYRTNAHPTDDHAGEAK